MIWISYWVFPVISGLVWLATLLGLLLYWIISTHSMFYPSMEPGDTIAYISDVGASTLKPLFVTGCVITTIFLDLAFAYDRWLRHKGRLVPNATRGEKILKTLTIIFAIIGTAGLILLSIFDTLRHKMLHRVFLLLFVAGYLLSAVFICWEYQILGKKNRDHRMLSISFWVKLVFVVVEFILAVAFSVTLFKARAAGAVLEWVIAFVFSFYLFSFVLDLWPAIYTRDRSARYKKSAPISMEEATSADTTPARESYMDRHPANF